MAEPMDELIPTRATLIQRLKDWQDQSSWQDFFDTYWKLIYGVALKGGLTEAEAQDVVQETMIAVAKHMPTFEYDPAIGSFKTWLLNMTRWRITDQLRKRGPFQAAARPDSEDATPRTRTVDKVIDPSGRDLDALWNTEWEKNLLEAAMTKVKRQLDPQKYQIFDLYVNKEWPPEKVAATFGISVDQVYLANPGQPGPAGLRTLRKNGLARRPPWNQHRREFPAQSLGDRGHRPGGAPAQCSPDALDALVRHQRFRLTCWRNADTEHDRHGDHDGASLPLVADRPAERECRRERNDKNRRYLQHVGEGVGVF